MNVRIFWVRAMKCMCAQTRPRFILSSEGVFGGMEFEPMLTPREKSPLPENVPRGVSNPRHCGQRAQAIPTELFQPAYRPWYCKWFNSEVCALQIHVLHGLFFPRYYFLYVCVFPDKMVFSFFLLFFWKPSIFCVCEITMFFISHFPS